MGEGTQAGGRRRFGVFEVDLRAGEIRKHGLKIKIQEQPFQVLAMLIEHAGKVVTREELQGKLWPGNTFVDFDHGLNKAINKIREALNDSSESPRFVETVSRRGYRFLADVKDVGEASEVPASVNESRAGKQDLKNLASVGKPLAVSLSWKIAGIVLLLVIAGLAGWRLYPSRQESNASVSHSIRSLAVLPLESLSNDASQDYFADGMTDELITDLGQIRALRVISRTSVMAYKRTRKPLPKIARELNVDAVIEGTVLRSGDQVRITAQLIHAADDKHLWSASYEGNLHETLALQNKVARAIAEQVQINLTPQEQAVLKSARIVNPEAYDAYLMGRYFWNKRTADSLKTALDYFRLATQKDPVYALAYGGLADTYALLGDYQFVSPGEAYPKARAAATKALELEDTLAQAHASLAFVMFEYDWDWPGAEREFRRAIELNPGYETGHHWYAYYLTAMGRADESIAEIKRAQKLDPLSLIINRNLGWVLYATRQNDRAIEQLKMTLEMEPNFSPAHETLAWAYVQNGMYTEAAHEMEQIASVSGNQAFAAALDHAYQVSGYRGVLRQELEHMRLRGKGAYVSPLEEAYVYTFLDDKDRAFQCLQRAYQQRVGVLVFLKILPLFDPLRSDPRFQDLVHGMGLSQ